MRRKIFLLVLIPVLLFTGNIVFGQGIESGDPCFGKNLSTCCCPNSWILSESCSKGGFSDASSCLPGGGSSQGGGTSQGDGDGNTNNTGTCDPERVYTISKGLTGCCPSPLVDGKCDAVRYDDMGINISTDCLLRGGCSLNVYKVMGIRKSNENPTVGGFFQDIVLAATTFVGTVIVIALIVSGLIFAVGSISGKDTKKAKTILIDCFVGLLLVMGSYTIIRLIQFIATAGS